MTGPTPLGLADDPVRHGNKAAALARLDSRVPVPPGLVLPGGWLRDCLDRAAAAELGRLLDELTRCSPSELPALMAAVTAAAGQLDLADRIAELADRLGELGPLLAVRSSSADEDDALLSFAGVFDSALDVTADQLAGTVRQVWLSGFAPKALLHYRRLGRTPRTDHLSVLIQRAIQPSVAGVAFSEPSGDAYLEWTAGHGAELVGGLAVPTRERLGRADGESSGWRGQLRTALGVLAGDGTGHDVEWVFDGRQLWVVQVRPRTAALAGSGGGGLRTAPLYEGEAHDLVLGDCAAEYARIRNKRRLPRAIALAHGARVPAGWLVNWNRSAPADVLASWSSQLPDRVVLDFSPAERQHIVASAELPAAVHRVAAGNPSDAEFAFLCREYLRGEQALLSTLAADGSVYVEVSDDGLLALNRGFGSARPLTGEQLLELVGSEQADALRGTTLEHARLLHPRAALEWVVSEGVLHFVDYSAPAGTAASPALADTGLLSPGRARGRVQRLDIDDILTESSIAPIISIAQPVPAEQEAMLLRQLRERLELTGEPVIVAVARPIAVLSMLIGLVAGFLFEEGAMLSHLGILLREAGVPAALVGTGNLPPPGTLVELVHGTVVTVSDPAGALG